MKEIWTGLYCHRNYEVSNLGRARSLDKGNRKGIIRKLGKCVNGYSNLKLVINSKHTTIRMHRAVYFSFNTGDIGSDLVIDHLNGNKKDDRLENLELVSYQENALRYTRSIKTKFPTYITNMSSNKYFYISKKVNGKSKVFGRFNTIKEAVERRDKLINCNWDDKISNNVSAEKIPYDALQRI